ncbi:DNA-directed RNA polymerase I subunit RPA2 [Parelaphostrongylus tenuis]|uniref:DNA-directed RNA polymerase I subunit RPA2 n=1 Tax=Parelaphostrongylus tenuis TaxID=148309 RepID=A0AAD5LWH0_PARTN|nr:DNA-directed RNA polymerase I subunit RPA2 [Parelaphostrongylus tenuis]
MGCFSADGNYEVSFRSNVLLESDGNVTWVPPAMFKSSCRIDVEWFPFDEQSCTLVFGSWTYNSDEVILNWYNNIDAVQLTDYSYSGIWDVIDVPGYLINKKDTKESKIVFHIVIRRKTLFYTVILIIPTVLMAFLSMMAFYLPADSAEKISLTINLLLALVVFLLLVSKILPPTSNIPLMGKYLLLAFVLNITTVVVTVVIVNVYFRSALSHEMPDYVRQIFLDFLPRVLMMKRPDRIPIYNGYFVEEYCASEIFDASLVLPSMTATMVPFLNVTEMTIHSSGESSMDKQENHHRNCSKWKRTLSKKFIKDRQRSDECSIHEESCMNCGRKRAGSDAAKIGRKVKKTVEAIAYIAEHMKAEMNDKKIRDDWKYVAMVIDRLLLLLFFGITLGGTLGIICSAPHVFDFVDQDKVIKKLNTKLYCIIYETVNKYLKPSLDEDFTIHLIKSCDVFVLLTALISLVLCSFDEDRLVADLFNGYNSLIRPVPNVSSPPIEVAFSLALVLLINVDEKNQIMHTNVWPTMKGNSRWMSRTAILPKKDDRGDLGDCRPTITHTTGGRFSGPRKLCALVNERVQDYEWASQASLHLKRKNITENDNCQRETE